MQSGSVAATLPRLDPTQQAVVDHPGGPLLVLAGPGTGKTTTIVEAVAARIEAGVDPEQILVLTFSRKAAAELRTRITGRVAKTIREPLARTFHSYAYGVLRRAALLRGDAPPRLLTSAEQDAVVAELLRGDAEEEGAVRWPAGLAPALATAGFRTELRELLMRATERGVGAAQLAAWGRDSGREHWVHAAAFQEQYEGVTAFSTAGRGDASGYDPAELVRAAIAELDGDPELLRQERDRARWLFVDEYQDTDPAQVELLELLAGRGGNLVAVGDPDQAIYAFRGAEPRGIVEFPDRFRHTDGRRAGRVSLGVCRRSGAELLRISRTVAEGLPGPWEHRRLAPVDGTDPGTAEVHVFGSAAVEAAYLADVLRRAHLLGGLPWSQMAVVVRTAGALGPLRRALASAGVPVAVSADDLPLAGQPAVAPFLSALTALLPASGSGPEADGAAVGLDEPAAEALLASPLGGATVLDLRRLRRAVRIALATQGIDPAERGAPLATVLTDEALLESLPDHVARPARRVAAVLDAGRVALARDGTAEDVLWAMWQRSGLAVRWARASAAGGPSGAVADRDLDAVVALFDAAAGFVDRLPSADVRAFVAHLSAQELPGDTGAARAAAGETVRLLTAHASKGLEWDLVCVAGVQEGVWPDLRERTTLLGTEELVERASGIDGTAVDRRTLALAEERRLFYVACTRARRRLVVTAVEGALDGADAGATASRFLDLVAPPPEDGRPLTELPRSLTLPALVADLRRALTDPQTPPQRRSAAASVLRRLADEGVAGAAPSHWWGLAPLSDDAPLVPADDGRPRAPLGHRDLPALPAAVGARGGRGRGVAGHDPNRGDGGARGRPAGRRRTRAGGRARGARRRARPAGPRPGLVGSAAAPVGAGHARPVPHLARRGGARADRRGGRVRRHRRPGPHPREGRPAGARRRGTAGRRRPQDREDRRQEHRGARSAGRLPGGRGRGRVRRPRHRARAGRRSSRSAPAPRPRSSSRSRCPPTCRSARRGRASCWSRWGRAWARPPSRSAPARTARGARRAAAARCRSPAGR